MKPVQVLDSQIDLLTRLTDSPAFRQYLGGAAEAAMGYGSRAAFAGRAMDTLTAGVRAAYAYRVTGDMGLLVQHAAAQLDSTDRVDTSLAPTGCGFVRFDTPLPVSDIRGERMLAHWMVWQSIATGMLVWWFNDCLRDPDEVARRTAAEFGESVGKVEEGWGFIDVETMRDGARLGGETVLLTPEQLAATGTRNVPESPAPSTNMRRYAHALWLLLGQTVAVSEDEHVPSRQRRSAARLGLPGRVTVVRLRHAATTRGSGESLVQWAHRWVVRGHWRWQRYGAGLTEQRRIWIAPHVKGPEDLPLHVTSKVYDLVR